jgi:hypothetical protein
MAFAGLTGFWSDAAETRERRGEYESRFDAVLRGEVGFHKQTLSQSPASGSTGEGESMSKRVSSKKALANPVELNPFNANKGIAPGRHRNPQGQPQ